MKFTHHLLTATATSIALVSQLGTANAFGLGNMGVFQGATSVFNQVTGKLGNKLMGGEKARDIQAEHDKLYANFEAQTAGMDPASKRQLAASMDKAWASVEDAILMSNAQAYRAKNAPLLDFKKVAADSMGGFATQTGMNSVLGGAGMTGVMRSATMNGIVDGLGGKPTGSRNTWVPMTNPMAAPSVGAAATSAAGNATGKAIGSMAGNSAKSYGNGSDEEFEVTDDVNPLLFLGKAPSELTWGDLYRENGFIGWKRIEKQPGAEAYAQITGPDRVKAAIFNFSPKTGEMKAAFRILTVDPTQFNSVVTSMSNEFGEPHYASSGSMLRATWPNGAFVTSDMEAIIVGWSALAQTTQTAARPAAAAAN